MANKFTRFINSALRGPKGVVSNFQHATRIFVDNNYRLAPRTKFLYYVVFAGAEREVSFLLKSTDLPKFTFDVATKNVYNRNKKIYKRIDYDPISLTFHDDNAGMMHSLYSKYYSHYSSDGANSQGNHPNSLVNYSGNYGMGFATPVNFFRKVSLYTLSRHRFNGYELMAPRIKSWTHGNVDYASNEPLDSSMTIEYEGVKYLSGSVAYGSPDGFASLSYDVVQSPNVLGGSLGLGNVLGPIGDVLGGIESVFGDVSKKNILKNPGGFITTAISQINTYKNNGGEFPTIDGVVGELRNPGNILTAANTVGGIVGASFPKVGAVLGSIAATTATRKILQTQSSNNSFPQSSGSANEIPTEFP
jgi:hypothetical protein